jgi:hypothetical protein
MIQHEKNEMVWQKHSAVIVVPHLCRFSKISLHALLKRHKKTTHLRGL